jgi:hemerythrin-like domain-containing protein
MAEQISGVLAGHEDRSRRREASHWGAAESLERGAQTHRQLLKGGRRAMQPIGPLMIEHRLIEKMIKVMESKVREMTSSKRPDSPFIETAVDFIRTYADRCHHGKEEGILFRELKKKDISQEHRRVMDELLEEHREGRKLTGKLAEANERYLKGDSGAFEEIIECMKILVEFYPRHIEKEDKHFFIPIMAYFSKEERDTMLRQGYEFDQGLIHEKYRNIVEKHSRAGA